MKSSLIIELTVVLLLGGRAYAQADRAVPITSKTDVKKELFKYLVATKQSSQADEYKSMYQVDCTTPQKLDSLAGRVK